MHRSDANKEALRAVERVTGSKPVKGEDLLGSPEMKRQFAAAKRIEALRKKKT